MQTENRIRGGKREGAGRKPKESPKKVSMTFRIDTTVAEMIRSQPNQAEFIETLVTEFIETNATPTHS